MSDTEDSSRVTHQRSARLTVTKTVFTITQKLNFTDVLKWRTKRSKCCNTRVAKKAELVEVLKRDANRLQDGTLELVSHFPPEVSHHGVAHECCSVAFCKLYGISSKTKYAYWKIVTDGTLLEEEEAEELKMAKNEGRRQHTLLWMKNMFHLLCDILPTSDYSSKNYHLPKCMNKQALHKEYWEEFKAKQDLLGESELSEFKPYSRSTFCKLWLSEFKNYHGFNTVSVSQLSCHIQ